MGNAVSAFVQSYELVPCGPSCSIACVVDEAERILDPGHLEQLLEPFRMSTGTFPDLVANEVVDDGSPSTLVSFDLFPSIEPELQRCRWRR